LIYLIFLFYFLDLIIFIFRAAISAHSAFLDALNKIALFANQSKGGCDDLGKLLCRLVDEEKNIDMMKASAVTYVKKIRTNCKKLGKKIKIIPHAYYLLFLKPCDEHHVIQRFGNIT